MYSKRELYTSLYTVECSDSEGASDEESNFQGHFTSISLIVNGTYTG